MKKRIICLLSCLMLLLALPVSAAQPHIVDEAGLLTEGEIDYLEQEAETLARQYQMDVVILTVDSLYGEDVETYADDYYDNNGYGYGEEASGVLLLLAMDTREWAISTCGEGIYALTDYGIEMLFSEIAPELSEDDYYGAFCTYLDKLEGYFAAYMVEDPIDGNLYPYYGPGDYQPGTREDTVYYPKEEKVTAQQVLIRLAVALVIGAAAGGIAVFVMRRKMNTARPQTGAGDYMRSNSFRLSCWQDFFLYSHTSRTPRNNNGGSGGSHGGGGSSVHTSSSGRSHGGGHGHF